MHEHLHFEIKPNVCSLDDSVAVNCLLCGHSRKLRKKANGTFQNELISLKPISVWCICQVTSRYI